MRQTLLAFPDSRWGTRAAAGLGVGFRLQTTSLAQRAAPLGALVLLGLLSTFPLAINVPGNSRLLSRPD